MNGNSRSKVILRGVNNANLTAVVHETMEFCGWRDHIAPNAKVVVKPNLCTAVPEKREMSNTDVRITQAVCELLLTRTQDVTLVESSGLRYSAWDAFNANGHTEMAKRLGVKVVNLTESRWAPVDVGPAKQVPLPVMMMECDAFITLPVLKTHAITYYTGALKNQWGCVPQHDRILLHQYLDPMLALLHAIFRPKFAVMDAIVGMEGRGPVGGKPRRLDLILASSDSVALDATAMRLVGLDPALCCHIQLAAQQKLGLVDAAQIAVDGDWERHQTQFEPAICDKAIAAMDYMSRYPWFVKYMLEKDLVFYPFRAAVQVLRKVGIIEGA
jgi:uncharacterized protein (DUF362 family)